ncbi:MULTISPECIES: GNAT family N-acetyltransferase [Enterococcus]|uniref:N-acetyltransferase domain-containing protein n=1 Tax=Candidatus Enterococcus ferrettii TaxID=2815324 RepID=A0ABV0EV06_9ENTE|nr:GNAT family N-acetyltransferase [Enterococcus sp. 665A]
MAIQIKVINDLEVKKLQKLSLQTFNDTFSAQNTPENMEAYVSEAFQLTKLAAELQRPDSTFFFIYTEDQLAGYLKVNIDQAQTEDIAENALEIERIYVDKAFKGQGLGKRLIAKAITIAQEKNKSSVWLGVWEKNEPALGFYKKLGFQQVTSHSFWMGDDEQTDLIMVKTLK